MKRSYFRAWREMALRYERFYGDISAFGVITRIWPLRSMLGAPGLAAKLVYGSDFPVAPMPLSCIGRVQFRRALAAEAGAQSVRPGRPDDAGGGVPHEVFARAEQLLRVPASKKQERRGGNGEGCGMNSSPLQLPWTLANVPHAVLDILRGCNIRCRDCYNLPPDHIKPLAEIEAQLDALTRLRRLQSISIVGGEITLHPDLVEIVRRVRKRGLFVELFTNGVDLTESCLPTQAGGGQRDLPPYRAQAAPSRPADRGHGKRFEAAPRGEGRARCRPWD